MTLEELLAHYRECIRWMEEDIAAFEAGRFTMGEVRIGGPVDTTAEWVATLKARVANLKAVIASAS